MHFNIVEVSFVFMSLAKSEMLRLPDEGTASERLKEKILSWSEEFENSYDENGDHLPLPRWQQL